MTTITPLPMHRAATLDEAIGLRVRQLLIGRGTQGDLAAALGIKQPDVSRRLRGVTAWRASEVAIVAQLLDVPIAALYGESPASSADEAMRARRDSNPQPSEPEPHASAAPALEDSRSSLAAPMILLAGLVLAATVEAGAR